MERYQWIGAKKIQEGTKYPTNLTYPLVDFFFTHPPTDAGSFLARRLGGGAAHVDSFDRYSRCCWI